MAAEPDHFKMVRDLKEWHVKLRHEIGHAAMCALNLAETPDEMETQLFIVFLEKSDDPNLPYAQRYSVKYCVNAGIEHCKKHLFGPEGDVHFQHLKEVHEYSKTKQSWLGCMGVVIRYDGIADFTLVRVPPVKMLRTRVYMWDWRPNPTKFLNEALEKGIKIPDPLEAPYALAFGDEDGNITNIPEKIPFKLDDSVIQFDPNR